LEEGLVEVGWDGDLQTELAQAEGPPRSEEASCADDLAFSEELIEDRYAALQAWTEWTRGQGRQAGTKIEAADSGPGAIRAPAAEVDGSPTEAGASPPVARNQSFATPEPDIRVESQHDFAPYSQLFSRLHQSKQSGP
jgi:general secretion pathway protein A